MKEVTLYAPFTGGMVTDLPAHQIGPQNSAFAQDGYSPNGFFRQRNAWAYDGTTADVADNLTSVYRAKFILADVTRTVTGDDDGDLFIHNASASGTALFTGSVQYLPRCIYRDELIWCAQDGATPLRRYAGAGFGSALGYTGTVSIGASESYVTGTLVLDSNPGSGSFCMPAPSNTDIGPRRWYKVLESTVNYVTLENVRAASASVALVAAGGTRFEGMGYAWPAVVIYDAGTAVFTDGTSNLDGFGTKWSTGGLSIVTGDANGPDGVVMLPSSGTSLFYNISAVTDDDDLTIYGGNGADVAKSNYQITRRCPFIDAAAHKGSFWGTGVAQYPTRVYVGPVGWDISGPPGEVPPYDPARTLTSENPNDWVMDYIDVPADIDGDPVVAILSSPNPLLVLKRKSVHGIFGSFGGLSADLIADGIGCIDIRSAQSYDEGQFWAGENGIFWYANGTITDLTRGKINREWRALTRDFDYGTSDYCSLFVASGHLIVHITTAAGTVQRTYLCDLRDQSWQSRISNVNPRYGFTSRVPGEKEKALWVSNDRQGRVMDFAPALDGSGTADDDAGSAPRLQAYTTSAIAQSGGIDGMTRLVDLHIHANVVDAGAAASTQVEVSVVSGGGIANAADSTKTLDTINSDTVDRIDRHTRRVAREGRFHQVRFEVDTLGTDTNATKVEIHQINARIREWRRNA